MLVNMLKSKIHRATITVADLNYEGSISIDKKLMKAAGIMPYELVHVLNVNNGQRFETYAIEAAENSGTISLNGAAARLGQVGDIVIILSYAMIENAEALSHKPKTVHVNQQNHLI